MSNLINGIKRTVANMLESFIYNIMKDNNTIIDLTYTDNILAVTDINNKSYNFDLGEQDGDEGVNTITLDKLNGIIKVASIGGPISYISIYNGGTWNAIDNITMDLVSTFSVNTEYDVANTIAGNKVIMKLDIVNLVDVDSKSVLTLHITSGNDIDILVEIYLELGTRNRFLIIKNAEEINALNFNMYKDNDYLYLEIKKVRPLLGFGTRLIEEPLIVVTKRIISSLLPKDTQTITTVTDITSATPLTKHTVKPKESTILDSIIVMGSNAVMESIGGKSMPDFIANTFVDNGDGFAIVSPQYSLDNDLSLATKVDILNNTTKPIVGDVTSTWKDGNLFIDVNGSGLTPNIDVKIHTGTQEIEREISKIKYLKVTPYSMSIRVEFFNPLIGQDLPIKIALGYRDDNIVKVLEELTNYGTYIIDGIRKIDKQVFRIKHYAPEMNRLGLSVKAHEPLLSRTNNMMDLTDPVQYITYNSYKIGGLRVDKDGYSDLALEYYNDDSIAKPLTLTLTSNGDDYTVHYGGGLTAIQDLGFRYLLGFKGLDYRSYYETPNGDEPTDPNHTFFGYFDLPSKNSGTVVYHVVQYINAGAKGLSNVMFEIIYHGPDVDLTLTSDVENGNSGGEYGHDVSFTYNDNVGVNIFSFSYFINPLSYEDNVNGFVPNDVIISEINRMAIDIDSFLYKDLDYIKVLSTVKRSGLSEELMEGIRDEVTNYLGDNKGVHDTVDSSEKTLKFDINGYKANIYPMVSNGDGTTVNVDTKFVKAYNTTIENFYYTYYNRLFTDESIHVAYETNGFNNMVHYVHRSHADLIIETNKMYGFLDTPLNVTYSSLKHPDADETFYAITLMMTDANTNLYTYGNSTYKKYLLELDDDRAIPDEGYGYDSLNRTLRFDTVHIGFKVLHKLTLEELKKIVIKVYDYISGRVNGINGIIINPINVIPAGNLYSNKLDILISNTTNLMLPTKKNISPSSVKTLWVYNGSATDSTLFNTTGCRIDINDNYINDPNKITHLLLSTNTYEYFTYHGRGIENDIMYSSTYKENVLITAIKAYPGNYVSLESNFTNPVISFSRFEFTGTNYKALVSNPTVDSGENMFTIVAFFNPVVDLNIEYDNSLDKNNIKYNIIKGETYIETIDILILQVFIDGNVSDIDLKNSIIPILDNIDSKINTSLNNLPINESAVNTNLIETVSSDIGTILNGYSDIISLDKNDLRISRKSDSKVLSLKSFNSNHYPIRLLYNGMLIPYGDDVSEITINVDGIETTSKTLFTLRDGMFYQIVNNTNCNTIKLQLPSYRVSNDIYTGFRNGSIFRSKVLNIEDRENVLVNLISIENEDVDKGSDNAVSNYITIYYLIIIFDGNAILNVPYNGTNMSSLPNIVYGYDLTIDTNNMEADTYDITTTSWIGTDEYRYTDQEINDIALKVIEMIDG